MVLSRAQEGECFVDYPWVDARFVRQFEGSCYYYNQFGAKWTNAEASCVSIGGHLACLNDETEVT